MDTLQAQLQEVTDKLAQLDPNNRDNLIEIAGLKARQNELNSQIEQEDAQKVVIQEATAKADTYLDNFEIEGLTLSQLTVSSDACDLLRGGIQIKLVELEGQAANNLKLQELSHKEELRARDDRESQLQRQNEQLQERLNQVNAQSIQDAEEITRLGSQIAQFEENERALQQANRDLQAESADFQSKLKNATDEIDRLNSHIDDLRKEIAVGAQQAYKVVDIEGQRTQMKELADKIKASRIHVYDVVPDADFNPKNFTAKRADTGETVQYNWTQANNYIELKDAAEVERFRAEHAQQSNNADSTLDHAVEVQPVPEVTAPDVQFPVDAGTVQEEVQVADGNSAAPVAGTTLEERVAKLEALVKECCEVCNVDIAEVA